MSLAPDDPRHGTDNGYRNLKCRCQPCRDAAAKWMVRARQRRANRLAPDDPRHGSDMTYTNHACRCDACRAAHAEARRLRKASA